MFEITLTEQDGSSRKLTSEKASLMIGKAEGNDIMLQSSGVSRYHARLSLEDGKAVIEDLGSTNGTFVNSERIERHVLARTDKALIGNTVLTVLAQQAQVSETAATVSGTTTGAPATDAVEQAPSGVSTEVGLAEANTQGEDQEFYWKSLKNFLGPVWQYVLDEDVSEIMINGPAEIFIESKGELRQVPEKFTTDTLNAAILNIAQYVGRRISEEEPYLDARLPDGSRVAVLMPPCSRKGASIAIRKFAKEALTVQKLLEFGSFDDQMRVFLDAAVRLKKNVIVSGGTSSGKTSLLNVLSTLIPQAERIITIEDSAELQLVQDHVLPMETKPPDKRGRGQVTIRDLVKVSLRMRPDRIIVGEIRGGEAIDLLQAMNTGHSGSMASLHASSPTQACTRLETLALFSGLDIPIRALREQVSSAVDIIIQASRLPDHSRRVTHISEVLNLNDDGTYNTGDIFRFERTGLSPEGKILGEHRWTGLVPTFIEEMELSGMTEALALFASSSNNGASKAAPKSRSKARSAKSAAAR